jgi:hypothetical protein
MVKKYSEEEIKRLLTQGYLSPKVFCESIIQEINGFKLEMEDFHSEWFELAMKERYLNIIAARGHGKSTMMAIAYPIWKATYHPHRIMFIMSPEERRAKENLQTIRNIIETNPVLRFLHPKKTGEGGTWTKDKITTSNHCQIYCGYMSPNTRGFHVDELILEETGRVQGRKLTDIFWSIVYAFIETRKGNLVGIGTPEHANDLGQQMKRKSTFKTVYYPVISNGKILWPKKFTINDLKTIRINMGKARFNREYLLQISSGGDTPFTPNMMLASQDLNLKLIHQNPVDDNGVRIPKEYYIGVDLAESPKGDFSVFAVLERVGSELHLVHFHRYRGVEPTLQINMALELCLRFPPRVICVDNSRWGMVMVESLLSEGLPVVGYNFNSRVGGGGRTNLLFELQKAFTENIIKIPCNENDRPILEPLFKEIQLLEYVDGSYISRARHDDCPIALGLAVFAASKYGFSPSLFSNNNTDETEVGKHIYNGKDIYGSSYSETIENNRRYLKANRSGV